MLTATTIFGAAPESAPPPPAVLEGGTGALPRVMTHPRVFVVDDDEGVRTALGLLLHSFGWQTQVFATAAAALAALGEQRPDCVVLDLNMPGMDGVEMLQAMHAHGHYPGVVAITGHKDSPLIARAWAEGISALLLKPFEDEELRSHINRVMNSGS